LSESDDDLAADDVKSGDGELLDVEELGNMLAAAKKAEVCLLLSLVHRQPPQVTLTWNKLENSGI